MSNLSFGRKFDQSSPGLVVILLDQSLSMESKVGDLSKAQIAATAINRTIEGLIERCRRGPIVEDKLSLCVIGYGAKTHCATAGPLSELDQKFIAEEEVATSAALPGGAGKTLVVRHKIWVEPVHENSTPMAEAFDMGRHYLHQFLERFPDAPAPIVINVTDGAPNDLQEGGNGAQTKQAAASLRSLDSMQERCLLMCVHVGREIGGNSVVFPHERLALVDPYEAFLFDIASPLPPELKDLAIKKKLPVQDGSRLLAINASPLELMRLLDFGSSVPV